MSLYIGVDSSITDKWGKDVFQVAEAFGELEAVEMLQKTEWSDDEDTNNDNEEQHANHDGNDIEVTKSRVLSKMMEAPLDETLFRKHLQSRDVCVNGRDFYGNSAVHKCAAWNKDKALNLLLNHVCAAAMCSLTTMRVFLVLLLPSCYDLTCISTC